MKTVFVTTYFSDEESVFEGYIRTNETEAKAIEIARAEMHANHADYCYPENQEVVEERDENSTYVIALKNKATGCYMESFDVRKEMVGE